MCPYRECHRRSCEENDPRVFRFSASEQHNIIDALMTGAANALKICGYLIANLIAFISALKFLDRTISWFFNLVRHPEVNFQYLLGLMFYPFAVIIGIPLRDCLLSSKLIGIKVSLNEVAGRQIEKAVDSPSTVDSRSCNSSLPIKNLAKFVLFEINSSATTPFLCI